MDNTGNLAGVQNHAMDAAPKKKSSLTKIHIPNIPSVKTKTESRKKVMSRMIFKKRAVQGRIGWRIGSFLTLGAIVLALFVIWQAAGGILREFAPAGLRAPAPEGTASTVQERQDRVPYGVLSIYRQLRDFQPGQGTVRRFGNSSEKVLVGQRISTVKNSLPVLDLSVSMRAAVEEYHAAAGSASVDATMMSDYDYENLLQIVEAEAGVEDLKGKILVANVIMNRVKNELFPNTVTDVVFQYENGVAQFSPVDDGRIYEVTVSEETKEAVKQALEGVDYSEGALFFIHKNAAEGHNISWFESDLKFILRHGVHEFYTYPDPVIEEEPKESNPSAGFTSETSS